MVVTVLVVEDEAVHAAVLRDVLAGDGYHCLSTVTGTQALELVFWKQPGLVLLDVSLPDLDGFEVCRQLRARSAVPLIMLGDDPGAVERVVALRVGADDYLVKPVLAAELRARIAALFRRLDPATRWDGSADASGPPVAHGPFCIDPAARTVTCAGVPVLLTRLEFDLLWFFISHPGRTFSREQLLAAVWPQPHQSGTNTVDTVVTRLRKKLEHRPSNPRYLRTVRGQGYRLDR